MFLEIPVELLRISLSVEAGDPLAPIMDAANKIATKSNKPMETSLVRLVSLSQNPKQFETNFETEAIVLRDLWVGNYWSVREQNLDIGHFEGESLVVESIPKLDLEKNNEGEVKSLILPLSGWLSKETTIPKDALLGHVRLRAIKSEGNHSLRSEVEQKEDRTGRKYWVYKRGPFKSMISSHIEKVPGFEVETPTTTDEVLSWDFSPEVEAMLASERRNLSPSEFRKIVKTFQNGFKQEGRGRLEQVEHVVGFRQDMWDAVQTVFASASNQVLMLSSFSQQEHLEEYFSMFNELQKPRTEVLMAFGEPDRGRDSGSLEGNLEFMKAATSMRPGTKGGVTPKPSHSKVMISDTGKVFIPTCNLLSGSMNSGVLEAGLLIQDWRCALSTLDALFEDGCIPSEIEKEARILRQSLNDAQESRQSTAHNKNLINDKLKEINNDIDHQRLNFAIVKFQRLLADLAERPVWSLIRTSHHRPLLEDCISKFRTRLVLASDGLRKNGLDKSMIDAISTTAAGTGGTLHVWWGRHAPFSKPIDEADERGRKDAASQLNQLRKNAAAKNWRILPPKSNQPMESHVKLFMVEDKRLVLTSDNTLSFGDTMLERGDASELGILLDHPRLTRQIRGSMESWLPEFATIKGDSSKWWSLFGDELNQMVTSPYQQVPLVDVLDRLIERIQALPQIQKAWENEIENNHSEIEIINTLAKGVRFHVYCISKSSTSNGVKTRLHQEQVDAAMVSQAFTDVWSKPEYNSDVNKLLEKNSPEEIKALISELLCDELSQYASKTGRREHFIVTGGLSYTLLAPNILKIKFKRGFVYPYLTEHENKIKIAFQKKFPASVEILWHTPKEMVQYELPSKEINPEIWSDAFVHHMRNPKSFEFVSSVYLRMIQGNEELRIGKGKLGKYIQNQCSAFLEVTRKDKPVANSLWARQRSD